MNDETIKEEAKTIDFNNFDTIKGANEGTEVRLFDPRTKRDLDIYFQIIGEDSDICRDLERKQQVRRNKKMSKGGFRSLNNLITPEELESDRIEKLSACTCGWYEVVDGKKVSELTMGGKKIAFSEDAAKEIYRKFPAIREQVEDVWADRSNF